MSSKEKLKYGRMDKTVYWITLLTLWVIMAGIMLLGVDPESREGLSNIRIAALLVLLIPYLIAIIMRLRDAGMGMGHLVICFAMPLYILLIGAFPSEEVTKEELERRKEEKKQAKKQEKINGKRYENVQDWQNYGRY